MPRISRSEIDGMLEGINKDFRPDGADRPIIMRGSVFDSVRTIPCSSPALSWLLGGGWYLGKLMELFGQEGSGKSSTAICFLKDCLQFWQGEKVLAYIDCEHRFNDAWAIKLGLSVDENLIVAQPTNGEQATDIMSRLIQSKKVGGIVFDSIASAQPDYATSEFSEKATRQGGNAAVMARNVLTMAPFANLFNSPFVSRIADSVNGTIPGTNSVAAAYR